jgi:hypothetical protein
MDSIMSDRRARFREMLRNLDGAAHPVGAFERHQYVQRPDGISTRIAGSLEVKPVGRHLLVGGIGCGKTTELLAIAQRLREAGDIEPFYFDLSLVQDLAQIRPGTLAVHIGLILSERSSKVGSSDTKATETLRQLAAGTPGTLVKRHVAEFLPMLSADIRDYLTYNDWVGHRPALVTPPPSETPEALRSLQEAVASLVYGAIGPGRFLVVLVDSLDRAQNEVLKTVTENDLPLLSAAGVGVVVTASSQAIYGANRTVPERFEHIHQVPVISTETDEGNHFLRAIVRGRADPNLLGEEAIDSLVVWSGGVLRDLVLLTAAAGEEAYLQGASRVEEGHVRAAAENFGRKRLLGLGSDSLNILKRVDAEGHIVPASNEAAQLLATQRILDRGDSVRPRYVLHPTLQPLLRQVAA